MGKEIMSVIDGELRVDLQALWSIGCEIITITLDDEGMNLDLEFAQERNPSENN